MRTSEKSSPEEDARRRNNLTKLSYEITLWVKDEELILDVMKTLANVEGAKTPEEILLRCREIILEVKNN